MQRTRGYASYDCVGGDIVRDDGVGADGGMVSDGDSTENGDTAANPDLLPEHNRLRGVAGVAQRFAFRARVIGIADAGVFADHTALAERDAGHGDQMHTPGEHNAVAEGDGGGWLGFEMQIGIEKCITADENVGAAVHGDRTEDYGGRGKWLAQMRCERCVRVKTRPIFVKWCGQAKQDSQRRNQNRLER